MSEFFEAYIHFEYYVLIGITICQVVLAVIDNVTDYHYGIVIWLVCRLFAIMNISLIPAMIYIIILFVNSIIN